ncbi:MAG: 50S ribosomal protein L24 [Deltaproteobacteria bacterium GWC2_56_8]|nr:MAG: 50S ribosomal protein L24 [Deltaproteobacteria bacterium GWB2_55_19]OGP32854.1 MAG: 50S ribosomal protein L24 [Deltaproteobacteria bacterium GWC2_56_8]HAO92884.1 50S ribosomal protein L24 [Deltaproteobacteria bacterium]
MSLRIRKEDQIMVIAGKEKGKTGKVMRVQPDKGKVFVEKVNMVKRHQKPTAKYKQGGIIEKEGPIAISNVMLLCAKCKGPVRTGVKADGDKRVRVCKKCGEVLDK